MRKEAQDRYLDAYDRLQQSGSRMAKAAGVKAHKDALAAEKAKYDAEKKTTGDILGPGLMGLATGFTASGGNPLAAGLGLLGGLGAGFAMSPQEIAGVAPYVMMAGQMAGRANMAGTGTPPGADPNMPMPGAEGSIIPKESVSIASNMYELPPPDVPPAMSQTGQSPMTGDFVDPTRLRTGGERIA